MVSFLLYPLILSGRFGALNHHDAKMMGMGWRVMKFREWGRGCSKPSFVEALACLSLDSQPLSDVSLVRYLKDLIVQLSLKTKRWRESRCCLSERV